VPSARQAKGLSWRSIADTLGRHVLRATTALLGQATTDRDEKAAGLLGLGPEVAEAPQQYPSNGSLAVIPPTRATPSSR
jgi:cyanate lyase